MHVISLALTIHSYWAYATSAEQGNLGEPKIMSSCVHQAISEAPPIDDQV